MNSQGRLEINTTNFSCIVNKLLFYCEIITNLCEYITMLFPFISTTLVPPPPLRHVVKSHKIMNFFFNSGTHLSFGNVYLSRKTRHYATAGCYVCVCVCVRLFSSDIYFHRIYISTTLT